MRAFEGPARITPLDELGVPVPGAPFELPARQPHVELRNGAGRLILEIGPRIRPWRVGDDDEMTGAGAWPTQ
jgi:hypothetical protein